MAKTLELQTVELQIVKLELQKVKLVKDRLRAARLLQLPDLQFLEVLKAMMVEKRHESRLVCCLFPLSLSYVNWMWTLRYTLSLCLNYSYFNGRPLFDKIIFLTIVFD